MSETTNTPINVISPKALEKQLKIVEGRMSVLQTEITDLQKIKDACLTLLGVSGEQPIEVSPETPKGKKRKASSEENAEKLESVSELSETEDDTAENTAH